MRRKAIASEPAWRVLRHLAGLDGTPPQRRSDRIEGYLTLLLVAAFALAAPVAAWASGQDAYRDGVLAERAEQATRSQTVAVLLANAAISPPSGDARPAPVRVRARWTAPDGTQVTGPLTVSSSVRKGTRITMWVDRTGRPVNAPQRRAETIANAATRAGFVALALAVTVLALLALLRRALQRQRLAEWQTAWLRVEPLWSGRRRHGPHRDGSAA